jgi:hypothetical protein
MRHDVGFKQDISARSILLDAELLENLRYERLPVTATLPVDYTHAARFLMPGIDNNIPGFHRGVVKITPAFRRYAVRNNDLLTAIIAQALQSFLSSSV